MKLWETGAIYKNGKLSAADAPSADGAKKNFGCDISQPKFFLSFSTD